LELTPVQKAWTRIRPVFKWEFATISDDKLIIDGLANRPNETPRMFFSHLEKLFHILEENYASYQIKPARPAPQPQGGYLEDALTTTINDSFKSYSKFLLVQVF
jgi:hypothetical protein